MVELLTIEGIDDDDVGLGIQLPKLIIPIEHRSRGLKLLMIIMQF